jgi:hypothetical protein
MSCCKKINWIQSKLTVFGLKSVNLVDKSLKSGGNWFWGKIMFFHGKLEFHQFSWTFIEFFENWWIQSLVFFCIMQFFNPWEELS